MSSLLVVKHTAGDNLSAAVQNRPLTHRAHDNLTATHSENLTSFLPSWAFNSQIRTPSITNYKKSR